MNRSGMSLYLLAYLYATGFFVPAVVHAQTTDPASPSELLVPVVVPGAICAVVSDTHNLLVIGSDDDKHQLSIFSLAGNAAHSPSKPAQVNLPKPALLGNAKNRPLGMAFHPKLPLLYVWQDITADAEKIYIGFNHLIVYAIEPAALRQVAAYARGPEFAHGLSVGAIAIDPQGHRIFLPNLQDPNNGGASIGYFDLDGEGMPRRTRVPIQGTLDGRGLNRFELVTKPVRVNVSRFRGLPTGWGFVAPSLNTVIFTGAGHGPAVWDTQNRRAAIGLLPITTLPGDCLIAADAQLSVLFGAAQGHDSLYRVSHADGYPTLLPHVVQLPGAVFHSAPTVIVANHNRLAVGGIGKVHFAGLNKRGQFTNEFENVSVKSNAVRALVYSRKSKRLYVAVEKD